MKQNESKTDPLSHTQLVYGHMLCVFKAADLMNRIGIEIKGDLNDYELCIASNLVDTRDINVNWEDIGGLQSTIDEINEVVILPFTRPDLFKSSELLRPPKGMKLSMLLIHVLLP